MAVMDSAAAGRSPHERILAAARGIVLTRGVAALSVQAVATAADVSKSAIAYHFGNKDGLIRAIIASMAVRPDDEPRQAVGGIEDPAQRFHAFMSLYLDRVKTSDNFRIAFGLGPTAFNDEKIEISAKTAVLDMQALRLPMDDPAVGVLMAVLTSAITGLAFNYVSRSAVMDLDACFAQLEQAMAPAFLRAMAAAGRQES
jgi:AcrR family transcriptional regulator